MKRIVIVALYLGSLACAAVVLIGWATQPELTYMQVYFRWWHWIFGMIIFSIAANAVDR